jgi:hypothetical protein
MKISEVRDKYSDYIVTYFPKKDYLYGINDDNSRFKTESRKDIYSEVFIAKDKDNKYYILYPVSESLTGSFSSRQKAIDWFKNGGR